MSSDSPSKEPDVADTAQSGEEQDQEMSREEPQGLGDFEVKEQDRWLPIANGWLRFICMI
jgi:nuclear transcription Y subunit beta